MGDTGICKFCGKSIWLDTNGWRHDSSGSMPICNNVPEPRDGATLADFAGTDKAFKRPHHALAFGFITTGGFLKEFSPDADGPITLARLTAEDIRATDWQEVKIGVLDPVFKHDCSKCKFLGGITHDGAKYDLYYCPTQVIGGATVVARFGNEDHEYTSGLGSPNPVLQIAEQRAREADLMD